eukprot:m.206086 g.206086  ORF g.206086 m.206086 type:complete len:482 (+) comp15424_c0_seq2:3279-4724(+)
MGCGGSKKAVVARPVSPPEEPPQPRKVVDPISPSEDKVRNEERDRALEMEAAIAMREDGERNYDEVRAVVFRSRIGEAYGFGMGQTTTGTVMVTDLMLGGLADGQLQVGDRVHSINGATSTAKTFEELIQVANESMTCMLVCTRLRGLDHPVPAEGSSRSSSLCSLASDGGRKRSFDEGFVGSASEQNMSPGSQSIARAVSVHTILPNVQLVKRRATIGRISMVHSPKFDTIREEQQDLSEPPPPGDQEFTVALKRESTQQTFGFSVVQYSDDRWVVSRIASNITNWGLLQVGDQLLSVGGRTTVGMEHDTLTQMIEKEISLQLEVRRSPQAVGSAATRRTRRGSISLFLEQTPLLNKGRNQSGADGAPPDSPTDVPPKGTLPPSLPVEESLTAQTWPGPPRPRPPPPEALNDKLGSPVPVPEALMRRGGPVASRRSTSPLRQSVTATTLTTSPGSGGASLGTPSLAQALAGILIQSSSSF